MGWFGSRKDGGRRDRTEEALSSGAYRREEDRASPTGSKYTPAASPTHGISEVVTENNDDGVVISRDETEDSFDDVNGNPSSFTRNTDADAENVAMSDHSKTSHVNSLFNGHLMKWKFEAEEGTGFIRVPACRSSCCECEVASHFLLDISLWSVRSLSDCHRRGGSVSRCMGAALNCYDRGCCHHVHLCPIVGRPLSRPKSYWLSRPFAKHCDAQL